MSWNLLQLKRQLIVTPLFGIFIASAVGGWAERPGPRLSPPPLGWVLSPDGTQAIEITGVVSSPRPGAAIALPAAASRLWSSPDGRSAIAATDSALFWVRSANEPVALMASEPASSASVAWDRNSEGFAVCVGVRCESRSASGELLEARELETGRTLLAFSATHGWVMDAPGGAYWQSGDIGLSLGSSVIAAQFRPRTRELWTLDQDGTLTGRTAEGGVAGQSNLLRDALGLAVSADGTSFLAVDAEGAAAVFDLRTGLTRAFRLETPPAGVWIASGSFAVRLHDSLKRPIAFWDGETGITGISPAAEIAEGVAIAEVIP